MKPSTATTVMSAFQDSFSRLNVSCRGFCSWSFFLWGPPSCRVHEHEHRDSYRSGSGKEQTETYRQTQTVGL